MPPRRPYIPTDSQAFRYHLLMWEDRLKNHEACRRLQVPTNTGRQWQYRLRRAAAAYYGYPVPYGQALAALFAEELKVV
jgi:hypothetical protein